MKKCALAVLRIWVSFRFYWLAAKKLAEDVEICEKIFDVKLKIEELWGVPPSCQRLVNDACNINGNMDLKSGVFLGGDRVFHVTCNVLDIWDLVGDLLYHAFIQI